LREVKRTVASRFPRSWAPGAALTVNFAITVDTPMNDPVQIVSVEFLYEADS
jgi:hypothetical protein